MLRKPLLNDVILVNRANAHEFVYLVNSILTAFLALYFHVTLSLVRYMIKTSCAAKFVKLILKAPVIVVRSTLV